MAISALAVKLGGRRIGLISRLAGDRHLFAFDPDYADDPERPTLSLSYKGPGSELVTRVRAVHRRLPPFFSNLLPEGHLRGYLAERAGVNPEREFFLMAELGADLAGAVTMEPSEGAEVGNDDPEDPAGPLRFSLAGVQLKFSAILEASGGLTIPAQGVGGWWIVKLPSTRFQAVAENELAMLQLARATGIETPACRLIAAGEVAGLPQQAARLGGMALAVERFDRTPEGARVHMEDFAQVFGLFPEAKYRRKSYANMAEVVWSEVSEEATFELVRRIVFSVLIGNGDMHLKNCSLLYRDGRHPTLAPAYDLLSTLPYLAGDELALNFGGGKSLHEVTDDQIRRFCDAARIPTKPVARVVQETAEQTAESWKALAEKDLLPAEARRLIDAHIQSVAAAITSGPLL